MEESEAYELITESDIQDSESMLDMLALFGRRPTSGLAEGFNTPENINKSNDHNKMR